MNRGREIEMWVRIKYLYIGGVLGSSILMPLMSNAGTNPSEQVFYLILSLPYIFGWPLTTILIWYNGGIL
jgi:hypothetical protein